MGRHRLGGKHHHDSAQVQEVSGKVTLREATKTEAGPRTLPLPPGMGTPALRTLGAAGDSHFIFTNNEGSMLAPGGFSRHFRGGRTGAKKKDGTDKVIIGVREKAKLPPSVTTAQLSPYGCNTAPGTGGE